MGRKETKLAAKLTVLGGPNLFCSRRCYVGINLPLGTGIGWVME